MLRDGILDVNWIKFFSSIVEVALITIIVRVQPGCFVTP